MHFHVKFIAKIARDILFEVHDILWFSDSVTRGDIVESNSQQTELLLKNYVTHETRSLHLSSFGLDCSIMQKAPAIRR